MRDMIKILGVNIDKITLNGATERVRLFLEDSDLRKPRVIYTPNTEVVMIARNNDKLKKMINKADMIIPDGIGLVHASRIKKNKLPERVTGFDISVELLKIANEKGYSLFILGGQEGVAEEAIHNITQEYPNLRISGYNHGYFKGAHIGLGGHEEELEVLDKINESQSDILFVGLGVPKQEIWIDENLDKLKCKVIIGNGGTVDVLAGRVPRAPEIYQKMGLEWLYRLIKEPKRIKRQMVLPLFVLMVLFSRDKIVE